MILDGMNVHVLPAAGVTVLDEAGPPGLRAPLATAVPQLAWHGGQVQTVPRIFIVFWGPKWTTGDGEYKALVGFFKSIGGHGWINIDTQYSGSNGRISNPTGQLEGAWIDPAAIPAIPSSAQVGAEAQKAALHFHYPDGISGSYIVALQKGVHPNGFLTSWCSWHTSENETEGLVAFTNFPYQSDVGTHCGMGAVNNPGTFDGTSIVAGHEEAETQTDPHPLTGWVDSSRKEIGDKCAWQNLIDNPQAGGYPTQPLWDNRIGRCAQTGP